MRFLPHISVRHNAASPMPFGLQRGWIFAGFVLLLLGGCTTAELAVDLIKKTQRSQDQAESAQKLADSTVVAKPRYKIGDPYNVGGVWYYPARDLSYDESGIGSWYGDEFAGRLTANGRRRLNALGQTPLDFRLHVLPAKRARHYAKRGWRVGETKIIRQRDDARCCSRGLGTRLLANIVQAALFTVIWKQLEAGMRGLGLA